MSSIKPKYPLAYTYLRAYMYDSVRAPHDLTSLLKVVDVKEANKELLSLGLIVENNEGGVELSDSLMSAIDYTLKQEWIKGERRITELLSSPSYTREGKYMNVVMHTMECHVIGYVSRWQCIRLATELHDKGKMTKHLDNMMANVSVEGIREEHSINQLRAVDFLIEFLKRGKDISKYQANRFELIAASNAVQAYNEKRGYVND